MEAITQQMFVWDKNLQAIVNKNVTFVPGLYKIFDEILVNAADNKIRDPSMNAIKIIISQERNLIKIWNNGKGMFESVCLIFGSFKRTYANTRKIGHPPLTCFYYKNNDCYTLVDPLAVLRKLERALTRYILSYAFIIYNTI